MISVRAAASALAGSSSARWRASVSSVARVGLRSASVTCAPSAASVKPSRPRPAVASSTRSSACLCKPTARASNWRRPPLIRRRTSAEHQSAQIEP
jgi:hypothetical protein